MEEGSMMPDNIAGSTNWEITTPIVTNRLCPIGDEMDHCEASTQIKHYM